MNMDTAKDWKPGFGYSFESSADERAEMLGMPARDKSEKGIALVVVLVLSAVVLAVMTALIYMITSGTQISGYEKRYKTALEAARGCNDVFYQVISSRGDTSTLTGVNITIPPAPTCTGTDIISGATYTGFDAKLGAPSSKWSTGCNSALTIDPQDSTTYDMRVVIGTTPQYNCYAKIVNTQAGNSASSGSTGGSGTGGGLYNGSVITGGAYGSGGIPVVSKPYLYAIEVNTENSSNPSERAKFSILYEY
jgi:uncharacterized membrane protein YgcG